MSQLINMLRNASAITALSLTAIFAGSGCSQPSTLQTVKNEGVLHVITRAAPSIYYEEQEGPTGYDYELARKFAEELGVELRVRVAEDNSEILSILQQNYAHIGLAGLINRPDFENEFHPVPIGISAQSIVVYHRDHPAPSSLEDLSDQTLHLLADSNHEHLIISKPAANRPEIRIHPGLDAADLLAKVDSGELPYAVISSNELDLNHVFYPMVKEAFSLSEPQELVWLFPPQQDDSLANAVQQFMERSDEDGSKAQLAERFYGHLDRLSYVGARTFMHHLENRLPRYQAMFESHARETGIDWRLLAAIGYQESHWRPNAVSPTGVRGLMMLTRTTAKYIGINNRLDAEESIEGGARYFKLVYEKIPDRIPEPDRTWFALASYNVGYGHLEDARRLTESAGKDPDRWMDVKEFLPLLAKKEWYSQTRFGYARGHEPVAYVQNIRRYYDVLARIPALDKNEADDQEQQLALSELTTNTEEEPGEASPLSETPDLRAALPPELSLIPPTL